MMLRFFKGISLTTYYLIFGLFGVFLRAYNYLWCKSFWYDEYGFLTGLESVRFSELLYPLEGAPGGGIVFMVLEKLMLSVFGFNEYALRFFPFIFGLLALYVLYKLLSYFKLGVWGPFIFLLCCLMDNFIYYSNEVRAYSIDLCLALIVVYTLLKVFDKNLSTGNTVFLGLFGVCFMWLSHSLIFCFAALGISAFVYAIYIRSKKLILQVSVVGFSWVTSFVLFYVFSLRFWALDQQSSFVSGGGYGYQFFLFPFYSLKEFVICFLNVMSVMGYSIGLRLTSIGIQIPEIQSFSIDQWISFFASDFLTLFYVGGLSFLVFCLFFIGAIHLWRNDKRLFGVLVVPFLLICGVSALELYPFRGRFLLFYYPLFLVVVVMGIRYLHDVFFRGVGVVLVILLVMHPLCSSLYHLVYPRTLVAHKQLLEYVVDNDQEGDYYVVANDDSWHDLYGPRFGIEASQLYTLNDYRENRHIFKSGSRVWVLLNEGTYRDSVRVFMSNFKELGLPLDRYRFRDGFEAILFRVDLF